MLLGYSVPFSLFTPKKCYMERKNLNKVTLGPEGVILSLIGMLLLPSLCTCLRKQQKAMENHSHVGPVGAASMPVHSPEEEWIVTPVPASRTVKWRDSFSIDLHGREGKPSAPSKSTVMSDCHPTKQPHLGKSSVSSYKRSPQGGLLTAYSPPWGGEPSAPYHLL